MIELSRLLDVARALRESKQPEAYDPDRFCWDTLPSQGKAFPVGTPADGIGHYAARPDLQDQWRIEIVELPNRRPYASIVSCKDGYPLCVYSLQFREYFGLDLEQVEDLFSIKGCGGAMLPWAAAGYIEAFVRAAKD